MHEVAGLSNAAETGVCYNVFPVVATGMGAHGENFCWTALTSLAHPPPGRAQQLIEVIRAELLLKMAGLSLLESHWQVTHIAPHSPNAATRRYQLFAVNAGW